MFRSRFWLALVLTVPTVIWGHMLMRLTGFEAPTFPGSRWIPPLFGTTVFFYGGLVFLRGAWRELQDRLPGMMTLISLAISVAFAFSVAVTLGFPGMPLWEELATLVTIMLLGHWIEMKSIFQAQGALKELAKLLLAPEPSAGIRVLVDTGLAEQVLPEVPALRLEIDEHAHRAATAATIASTADSSVNPAAVSACSVLAWIPKMFASSNSLSGSTGGCI